jgi:alkyl hydroperoxide reductase subunit AhpC
MKKLIAILIGVLTVIRKIKDIIAWGADKWVKLSPMIQPIIQDVEKAYANDGKIIADERKMIAMNAIADAEKKGLIKLNWLTRWVIGRVVDKVAQKLPDIEVSKESAKLVADAIARVKG